MKKQKESIVKLNDGRTIYKTHNGFKWFVETKKGVSTEVSEDYYMSSLKSRL